MTSVQAQEAMQAAPSRSATAVSGISGASLEMLTTESSPGTLKSFVAMTADATSAKIAVTFGLRLRFFSKVSRRALSSPDFSCQTASGEIPQHQAHFTETGFKFARHGGCFVAVKVRDLPVAEVE